MSPLEIAASALFVVAVFGFLGLLVWDILTKEDKVVFLVLIALDAGVYLAAHSWWGDLPALVLSIVISVFIVLLDAICYVDETARRSEREHLPSR